MRSAGVGLLVMSFAFACGGEPEPTGPGDAGDGGGADVSAAPDADAGAPPDATVGFTIGGTMNGLAVGQSVVLANGAATLTVAADGTFAFPMKVPDGATFDVRVALPPPSQTCRVQGGSGSVKSADVTTVAVTCRQRFAYLPGWGADSQSNFVGDVVMYEATGQGSLAVFGPPATVDFGKMLSGVAAHPSGDHLYVSDFVGKSVFQFDVGKDGRLTPMTAPSVPVAVEPNAVSLHPDGKAAYVVANGNVFQFAVDSAGVLTPMKVPSVASGFITQSLVVDAAGKHAYAANQGDGTVSQYDVASDGALTPMAPATAKVAEANDACGQIVLHPSGAWGYASCRGAVPTVGVVQFAIANDGKLSALGPVATTPTGVTLNVTAHPSGKWVYAVSSEHNLNPGRLSQFTVGLDGKLTPMSTPSVPTGVEPVAVAVDARGENVVVVDSGLMFSNGPMGADIFRYAVDPKTGALTYAETIPTPSKKSPRAFAFTP